MRRRVLLGSLAVHALAGALLLAIDRAPTAPAPDRAVTLVDIAVVPLAAPRALAAGGGAPGERAPAPAPVPPAIAPPPPQPIARRGGEAPIPPAPAGLAITGFDPSASAGGGGGEGHGLGGGAGAGLGAGITAGVDPRLALAVVPPAPPVVVSKARPPKLIYPAREGEDDEDAIFVARVTVDTDGYVVGARLLRDDRTRRAAVAADLIWRFRYAPALDDDGRAIKATIDQRFLVSR